MPAPAIRYVDLKVAEGAEDEVLAALDRTMTEPFVVETVADAEQQLGRAQAGFAGLAFLFGLVALAVGAFLVANTLAMTLAERTREVGLLRAAGTTSRQVMGLFLRQGLALGLLGGLVGVLLGVAVAAILITVLQSSRALLIGGLPFHPVALLLAFVLGALVTLAGALVPALAASRLSPLDALRPSQQPGRTLGGRLPWVIGPGDRGRGGGRGCLPAAARGRIALGRAAGGRDHAGRSAAGRARAAAPRPPHRPPVRRAVRRAGELGRANLGRDPVRTGLTVGALAIGLASVVALGIVTASARATADVWVRSILPGGYAIRLTVADEIDRVRDDLATIDGVDRVMPISEFPAVEATDDGQREVGIAGIGPSDFQDTGSLIFVAGERRDAFNALREGGAVLLPESIASREGLAVGDTITLGQPGGDGVPFTVAGIVAYSLPTRTTEGAILMSQADARESFGVTEASLFALQPQRGVPIDTFRDAVADKAADYSAESLSAAQLSSDLGRSLDRVIGLFDLLAVLAVVIGGIGHREHAGGRGAGAWPGDRHPALAWHDGRPGAGHGRDRGGDHRRGGRAGGGRHRRGGGLDHDHAWRHRTTSPAESPFRGACWQRSCCWGSALPRWPASTRRGQRRAYPSRTASSTSNRRSLRVETRFWEAHAGRAFVGRLATGTDLVAEIERFCAERDIRIRLGQRHRRGLPRRLRLLRAGRAALSRAVERLPPRDHELHRQRLDA